MPEVLSTQVHRVKALGDMLQTVDVDAASQSRTRAVVITGDAARAWLSASGFAPQTKPRATSTLAPQLGKFVCFSEKIFYARPDVLDEPLHVGIVAHASHVHHIRAKVA